MLNRLTLNKEHESLFSLRLRMCQHYNPSSKQPTCYMQINSRWVLSALVPALFLSLSLHNGRPHPPIMEVKTNKCYVTLCQFNSTKSPPLFFFSANLLLFWSQSAHPPRLGGGHAARRGPSADLFRSKHSLHTFRLRVYLRY